MTFLSLSGALRRCTALVLVIAPLSPAGVVLPPNSGSITRYLCHKRALRLCRWNLVAGGHVGTASIPWPIWNDLHPARNQQTDGKCHRRHPHGSSLRWTDPGQPANAFGLYGGTFNVSALQIHGRNLSADNLRTQQTSSGIETDRATRLRECGISRSFSTRDRLDVKIGQQSLDQEFITSLNAALFVNTMFG